MGSNEDNDDEQGTPRRRAAPRDYDVGYGRPPKATRFGVRAQPQRLAEHATAKAKQVRPDIAALLDQPIEIKRNGKRAKIHPHEAMLEGLFRRAMQGEVRALRLFLVECARAGLLDAPLARSCAVVEAPRDMPIDLAGYLICREGLPPWDDQLVARYRAEYDADLAHIATLKQEALAQPRAEGENVC